MVIFVNVRFVIPFVDDLNHYSVYSDFFEQADRGLQSAYTLYLALRAWCVLLSGSAQVAFSSTSIYKEKGMSLQTIKTAIAEKKMRCPECKEPVQKFDKFVEMVGSVFGMVLATPKRRTPVLR